MCVEIKVKELSSFFKKSVGLILSKNNEPIYFETRFGIHTFFMRKSIDVVVMDENFIVRVLKIGLKPWKIFVWNPMYYKVLELPENFTEKKSIKLGCEIKILV